MNAVCAPRRSCRRPNALRLPGSSLDSAGPIGADPTSNRPGVSKRPPPYGPIQCIRDGGPGSAISPRSLLQNQLVQSQMRDRAAKPLILFLKLLQTLQLLGVHAAVFLPPPVICHIGHADLADRIQHRPTLPVENLHLPQLRHDLFRLVSLSRHPWPSFPYLRMDQFTGGGSTRMNPDEPGIMVEQCRRHYSVRRPFSASISVACAGGRHPQGAKTRNALTMQVDQSTGVSKKA